MRTIVTSGISKFFDELVDRLRVGLILGIFVGVAVAQEKGEAGIEILESPQIIEMPELLVIRVSKDAGVTATVGEVVFSAEELTKKEESKFKEWLKKVGVDQKTKVMMFFDEDVQMEAYFRLSSVLGDLEVDRGAIALLSTKWGEKELMRFLMKSFRVEEFELSTSPPVQDAKGEELQPILFELDENGLLTGSCGNMVVDATEIKPKGGGDPVGEWLGGFPDLTKMMVQIKVHPEARQQAVVDLLNLLATHKVSHITYTDFADEGD